MFNILKAGFKNNLQSNIKNLKQRLQNRNKISKKERNMTHEKLYNNQKVKFNVNRLTETKLKYLTYPFKVDKLQKAYQLMPMTSK